MTWTNRADVRRGRPMRTWNEVRSKKYHSKDYSCLLSEALRTRRSMRPKEVPCHSKEESALLSEAGRQVSPDFINTIMPSPF
jgi:hypothetical protein